MSQICIQDNSAPKPVKIRVNVAAKVAGYSERTVRRFIQTGVLSAEREGKRRWLVPRTEVERMQRERWLSC
jgi:excisionase family DNA binding protein